MKSISGGAPVMNDVKSAPVDNVKPIVEVSANNPFIARDLDFATDWLSMLIYGDFGVGKTYLAGSSVFVEDYRDILYVALEGGENSLLNKVKIKVLMLQHILWLFRYRLLNSMLTFMSS